MLLSDLKILFLIYEGGEETGSNNILVASLVSGTVAERYEVS
jgi:hypothetical protein